MAPHVCLHVVSIPDQAPALPIVIGLNQGMSTGMIFSPLPAEWIHSAKSNRPNAAVIDMLNSSVIGPRQKKNRPMFGRGSHLFRLGETQDGLAY